VRQGGRADDVCDGAHEEGHDDQDGDRLFEDVTEAPEPTEGSSRPIRSPKPNHKYSPDDNDLNYVGNKSRTRSQRSNKKDRTIISTFAAVATHSFINQRGQSAVHLPDRSCRTYTLVIDCNIYCMLSFRALVFCQPFWKPSH
jgi:hypothetical protein